MQRGGRRSQYAPKANYWLWIAPCTLLLSACLKDLEPEVGELLPEQSSAPAQDGADDTDGSDTSADGTGAMDGSDRGSAGDEGNGSDQPSGNDGASNDGASNDGSAGEDGASSDGEPTDDGGMAHVDPTPNCDIEDSNPADDVSFAADVMPILAACRCHDPDSEDPYAILEVNLIIDNYQTLRAGGDNTGADIIVAGDPCESIILKKLSETPPFGERMPLDGPYLSEAERRLISDWIVEGARDN